MLLRSSSTPILDTWIAISRDSSPESDSCLSLQRPKSVTHLSPSMSLNSPSSVDEFHGVSFTKKITRTLSETDLQKQRPFDLSPKGLPSISVAEAEEEEGTNDLNSISPLLLLSSSGLEGSVEEAQVCSAAESNVWKVSATATVDSGSGLGSGDVGGICGGRGGGGSDDGNGGFENSDSNHGDDGTDAYYLKMIEADPTNSLLLSNYARFLKEVRGDLVKAEEYCARAILGKPEDVHVLSLYAELIWQTHRDSERAESYFNQAVQAAPGDSFILASYARFLWDVEEEDERGKERSKKPPYFPGSAPSKLPLTAAS